MAHRTWMLGLWLGLVGFSMATGCVVKSDDDDGAEAGAGGEAGDPSTGGSSTGGSSTGGRGGSGGSTGGSGATGGTSGTGGATGGTSGTGGTMNTMPVCDPDSGELDNDFFPNCTPRPDNPCEDCIQESCCELSQVCYGFNPGNVCGWGGIDLDDDDILDGEITCFIECAQLYVEGNDGIYDEAGADMCAGMCATEECGQIGNATNDMIVCLQNNCEARCFGATP